MPRRRGSETVRGEVVQKILEAIRTTEEIAGKSRESPALQAHWYRVMGYLAHIVDGLLENVDQSEADKQLAELKEIVVRLQKRSARDTGSGTTAPG